MPEEKKGRKRARHGVTPEQFVTAWQTSESAQEVADKLHMPKSAVLSRASNYRARLVNLKKMPRGRRLDVAALNNIEGHGGKPAA